MQSQEVLATQAENKSYKTLSSISGILLVAGTCIGAGMLALPVVTGIAGFYPGMLMNILCWLFMLSTGLLFLEATLWMKDGANVLSMSERFFGSAGKIICGLSFLFLYYCLQVSYIAGGAPLFNQQIFQFFNLQTEGYSHYLFALSFGLIVYLGATVIDRINWLLMTGLILSFIFLIGVGSTEVQMQYLSHQNWGLFLLSAPTLFSAYGYHNIVPSLSSYLKRNVFQLRLAIIVGTTIPFIIYSIWQWMIIGSVPELEIRNAASQGVPISQALQNITGHPWVSLLGGYFGFFALVTSFLGVSLSMVDFLADGLKISKKGISRLGLCLGVFLPPTLFAAANPGIFIEAIGYAGGFGEAILNGLFPIAMVWMGRYRLGLNSQAQLPGGRILLTALFLFTLLIMGLELYHVI